MYFSFRPIDRYLSFRIRPQHSDSVHHFCFELKLPVSGKALCHPNRQHASISATDWVHDFTSQAIRAWWSQFGQLLPRMTYRSPIGLQFDNYKKPTLISPASSHQHSLLLSGIMRRLLAVFFGVLCCSFALAQPSVDGNCAIVFRFSVRVLLSCRSTYVKLKLKNPLSLRNNC